MYESRPLLATGAKYRKLSFMLSDAILSGHGRFMSLSGAMGIYQKCITACCLQKDWFKLRPTSVAFEGLELFCTVLKNIKLCFSFLQLNRFVILNKHSSCECEATPSNRWQPTQKVHGGFVCGWQGQHGKMLTLMLLLTGVSTALDEAAWPHTVYGAHIKSCPLQKEKLLVFPGDFNVVTDWYLLEIKHKTKKSNNKTVNIMYTCRFLCVTEKKGHYWSMYHLICFSSMHNTHLTWTSQLFDQMWKNCIRMLDPEM